jgi:hypothetical protein
LQKLKNFLKRENSLSEYCKWGTRYALALKLFQMKIQSGADIRMNPVIKLPFWPKTGYSISWQFWQPSLIRYLDIQSGYQSSRKIGCVIINHYFRYSIPRPDTGHLKKTKMAAEIRYRTQIWPDIKTFRLSGIRLSAPDCSYFFLYLSFWLHCTLLTSLTLNVCLYTVNNDSGIWMVHFSSNLTS